MDGEAPDPRALAEVAPEPAAGPSPAQPAKRGSGLWLDIGLGLLGIAVLGVGGAFANAALSQRYSPTQATLDYFAAQARGDADGMMANATFLRGDGATKEFFDRAAVNAMLQTTQNSDVKNVRVVSTEAVDSSARRVNVAMMWAGATRIATYIVRKDPRHVNYFLYTSWRVEIPYTTIRVTLPNQPGVVQVDGIFVPSGSSATSIQVIEGYHAVTMVRTSFYDADTKLANGVDTNPTVTLEGKVNADATAAATTAIKASFSSCDASRYDECPNHTYNAPNDPNYIYYLTMPGYGEIDYKCYVFTIGGDPTAGMKLVVSAEKNKVTANGTCASTLTVDGSKKYSFTGTWSANLTWNGSTFASASVAFDCASAKA